MRADIKERIENTARLYKKIFLFRENSHFGPVFRSIIEIYNSNIITLENVGGNADEDLEQYAVIVCSGNKIYAEEFQRMLVESGYQNVFVPKDFGLIYSADKLDAIEFNLNIGCSMNCHYCPQDVLLNAYKKYGKDPQKRHLTFEDFKFIVDERMNPGASVSFSGMSEPFENNDFFKMLIYASENGNTILLNTTLTGLTEEMLDEMIRRKIKIECILHIPDNKGNSHFRITDTYVRIFENFIKYYGSSVTYITCHGDAPNDAIKDIVSNSGIEDIHYEDMMGARCGNLDETIRERPLKRKGSLVCTLGKAPILPPVCMPDGTLGLCCNDYALDTKMGNLLNDDWETILSGQGFQTYLQAMNHENMECICRYCSEAMERSYAIQHIYPNYLYYGENYYRIRALFAEGNHELVKRLQNAEHICIFGLGKFFKDNYFQAGWSKIIQADLLSDNNDKLWGKYLCGLPIVSKQQLLTYQNLLIIVYAMKPGAIIEDLQNIGICNVMSVLDIMGIAGGN